MRFEDDQVSDFTRRCEKKTVFAASEEKHGPNDSSLSLAPIRDDPVLQISGLLARTHFVSERQFIDVTDNTMMMMMMMIAFIRHDEFVQWDDKTDRRTSMSSVCIRWHNHPLKSYSFLSSLYFILIVELTQNHLQNQRISARRDAQVLHNEKPSLSSWLADRKLTCPSMWRMLIGIIEYERQQNNQCAPCLLLERAIFKRMMRGGGDGQFFSLHK